MCINAKLFEPFALCQSLQTIGRATDGRSKKLFNWQKAFRVLLLTETLTRQENKLSKSLIPLPFLA